MVYLCVVFATLHYRSVDLGGSRLVSMFCFPSLDFREFGGLAFQGKKNLRTYNLQNSWSGLMSGWLARV